MFHSLYQLGTALLSLPASSLASLGGFLVALLVGFTRESLQDSLFVSLLESSLLVSSFVESVTIESAAL